MRQADRRDALYEAIFPQALEIHPGDAISEQFEEAIETHVDELAIVVDRLEARAIDEGGDPRAARDVFLNDMLAVAGRLLHHDELFVVGMALKLAAILAGKGADESGLQFIFNAYEATVADELEDCERRVNEAKPALTALLFLKAADIMLKPSLDDRPVDPEAQCPTQIDDKARLKAFRLAVASTCLAAGALLEPDTMFGDLIQERAVIRLHEISLTDLESYLAVIHDHGYLGVDPATQAGACEIFFHSYDVLTEGMRLYCERTMPRDPDACRHHLSWLLQIDAWFMTHLGDDMRLTARAALAFEEHVGQMDCLDPVSTLCLMRGLHEAYDLSAIPGNDKSGHGLLRELIRDRLLRPLQDDGILPAPPKPAVKRAMMQSASLYCLNIKNPALSALHPFPPG